MKKLIRGVALPFFLWNCIYIILKLIRTELLQKFGGVVEDPFYLNSITWEHFWSDTIVYPLWYLRDLICMSILIPVFYFLSKRIKYWILLLPILYVANLSIPISGFSITAINFFGLGAYLAVNQISLLSIANKGRYIFIPISLIGVFSLPFVSQNELYPYLSSVYILASVFSLVYISSKLVKKTSWIKLENLSKAVFFIYAIHTIFIINWVKSLVSKFTFIQNTFGELFCYFFIGGLTVLISYLLYLLSRKLFPKITSVLVGGRL